MGVCDGENGRGLVRYEERLRDSLVPGMAMVICATWFPDRKWVVNVYAIIINDGEHYHGLRFALCLTVSGLPRERVYIKLT